MQRESPLAIAVVSPALARTAWDKHASRPEGPAGSKQLPPRADPVAIARPAARWDESQTPGALAVPANDRAVEPQRSSDATPPRSGNRSLPKGAGLAAVRRNRIQEFSHPLTHPAYHAALAGGGGGGGCWWSSSSEREGGGSCARHLTSKPSSTIAEVGRQQAEVPTRLATNATQLSSPPKKSPAQPPRHLSGRPRPLASQQTRARVAHSTALVGGSGSNLNRPRPPSAAIPPFSGEVQWLGVLAGVWRR